MHCSLVNDDDRAESSSGCGRSVHSGLLPASWAEPTRLADGACYAPSQGTHGSSCAGIRSFRWRPRRLLSGASSLQLQVLDFQKENEYGEVSLVDLGWRGKSASEPRDR